jgi:hypothetical protein
MGVPTRPFMDRSIPTCTERNVQDEGVVVFVVVLVVVVLVGVVVVLVGVVLVVVLLRNRWEVYNPIRSSSYLPI